MTKGFLETRRGEEIEFLSSTTAKIQVAGFCEGVRVTLHGKQVKLLHLQLLLASTSSNVSPGWGSEKT